MDSLALIVGGTLTLVAALAHLACIAFGAPAYRIMGAGSRIVRAAQAGELKPALITSAISAVLFVCALYAFSGAGLIAPLPGTPAVLRAVCAAFFARAIGVPFLKPRFPENSTAFWWWSSGICLVIAVLYAGGSLQLPGRGSRARDTPSRRCRCFRLAPSRGLSAGDEVRIFVERAHPSVTAGPRGSQMSRLAYATRPH